MSKKEYSIKITKTRIGRDIYFRIDKGTLAELIKKFSYTLEIGKSWNPKINRNPKTIKSFISNVQKSFAEKEACCYDRIYIELINK